MSSPEWPGPAQIWPGHDVTLRKHAIPHGLLRGMWSASLSTTGDEHRLEVRVDALEKRFA